MLVHRFFFAEKGFAIGTDFGGILRRVGLNFGSQLLQQKP
jgi:hypothetical protein